MIKNCIAETTAAKPTLFGVFLWLSKILPINAEIIKEKYTHNMEATL